MFKNFINGEWRVSSRVIVTEGIHDRFVAALAAKLQTLKIDDARKKGTDIDPVVDDKQLAQDLEYIAIGQAEGARLVTGGQAMATNADGNDTPFGLASGIATTSLKHATHFKRHAQAGMVMVNLPTAGVDYHLPFGGRKASSCGPRGQGRHAAEFYTAVNTACTQA